MTAYGLSHSVVVVEPGHQGIVYSRFSGLNKSRRLTEGMNFLLPYFERTVIYDTRARPQQITTQSGSKGKTSIILKIMIIFKYYDLFLVLLYFMLLDLQMVQISLRVLYRPDPLGLPNLYRRLGTGSFHIICFISYFLKTLCKYILTFSYSICCRLC